MPEAQNPPPPLPLTLVFSFITFYGTLEEERVIEEIANYVKVAANGPVNIRVVELEDDEVHVVSDNFYTVWLDGKKLWLDRRHDHERRAKGTDRRVTPREKDRRKRNNRRSFDIGHMPTPLNKPKEEKTTDE